MKKIAFFLTLAICSIASYGQINPKMSKLFDRLTEIDQAPVVIKIGGQGSLTWKTYTVYLHYRPDLYYRADSLTFDSLCQAVRSRLDQQVVAIRHTLDDLQEEAQESYHYEYHCGGKDTILYSMNLSKDTTRIHKYQESNHTFYNSDEYLSFKLEPRKVEGTLEGRLEYTISLPEPDSTAAPYDHEALTADIMRLFKQHRIKPRKAIWQHDKAYSDSIWANISKISYPDWGCYMGFDAYSLAGITDATIHTVPPDNEPLAKQLLAAIDSMVLKYTDCPQKLSYQYNYGTTFEGFTEMIVLIRDAVNPVFYYIIEIRHNEFGYHFLIAQTNGTLWVPLYWPSLKTIVNGEKTYFKGMKPKE